MKLDLKDVLKHSFVITIDDKRFNDFKTVFKYHKLSPMPKRFEGTTDWWNSPQYNCYLSHKKAILEAKRKKWPYVCIFEDDAYPCVNVRQEMEKVLKNVPDECGALALGYICILGNNGLDNGFITGFRCYGAHAYIVFKDAYDDYVSTLDKFPEGDGAFYSAPKDNLLGTERMFGSAKNLFIQFSKGNTMNNAGGYIYLEKIIPLKDGRVIIPRDKGISEEKVVEMGFPRAAEIFPELKTFDFNVGVLENPIFATVNCGTNVLTNITVKSILEFHPDAKIFVIDVPRKPGDEFTHIDDDTKNVEIVKGILWDDLNLPTIDVEKAQNITDEEKAEIIARFGGKSKIEVLPNGDYHHPTNIQFAIDNIGENFALIDSDAPLLFPVDNLFNDKYITIAQPESWDLVHLDRLRPLIRPTNIRARFNPCIQYMNVKMMKELGIKYFDKEWLQDNLDIAGWFKNPCCGGRESIFHWTGSLFFKKIAHLGSKIGKINAQEIVDHLGGGTWDDTPDRKNQFIQKYSHLFKNQNALVNKEDRQEMEILVQRQGIIRKGLLDFISSLELDNITMIEVGSYAGESSDMFASSGKVKTLWCIDPWLSGYDDTDKASNTNFKLVEETFDKVAEKHPTVIHKFKGVLEGFIKEHPEIHPDLVYIDACHTYEGCKSDILNALKLKPKVISGHDYAHWCPGVIKAVDEVLGKPQKTFCDGSWLIKLNP